MERTRDSVMTSQRATRFSRRSAMKRSGLFDPLLSAYFGRCYLESRLRRGVLPSSRWICRQPAPPAAVDPGQSHGGDERPPGNARSDGRWRLRACWWRLRGAATAQLVSFGCLV